MSRLAKGTLFGRVHDFLEIYLPKQQKVSPNTIRSYRKVLEQFLDFVKVRNHVPLDDVTFELLTAEVVNEFLADIEAHGRSLSTVNQRLAAIHAFIDYASKVDIAVVANAKKLEKVSVRKTPSNTAIDYMTEKATSAVLNEPDVATEKGLRDRCLMMLMYDAGARIQEIIDVTVGDLRFAKEPTVILHGKGDRIRVVPFSKNTAEHLRRHLGIAHKDTGQNPQEPLFYTVIDCKRKPLSLRRVRDMIKEYGKAAREKCAEVPENVHPHLFRHSRAMHLYQHGMDLTLISQWLGHAQLETTLVYAHADTEHKRKAIAAATSDGKNSPTNISSKRFTVSDDDTLKRLCGLK